MNRCTTMAKGNKILKIPKRSGSFKKSHSVHLCHCSFYARCHSKLPFLFTCIFSVSANNLSNIFLPGKRRRIPVLLFSAGMHTLSITYCIHYKAKEKQPDVHSKRKHRAWVLTDTSNFPGTSRVKGGQITESAQAHSYR